MAKQIKFGDVNNVATEPTKPIKPFVVRAQADDGGIITWQPGPHTQEHLQQLTNDEVDVVLDAIRKTLIKQAKGNQNILCLMEFFTKLGRPEDATGILAELLPLGLNRLFGS